MQGLRSIRQEYRGWLYRRRGVFLALLALEIAVALLLLFISRASTSAPFVYDLF